MELKTLIERAEKAAGSQKALGLMVGQAPSTLRAAKAGLQGLPDHVCVRLAELIGEEPMTVIAASKLVTEKKEEVRKIWRPFVARAASVILGAVILNMTPAPAEAAPMAKSLIQHCILCQIYDLVRLLGLAHGCFKDTVNKRDKLTLPADNQQLLIHPFSGYVRRPRKVFASSESASAICPAVSGDGNGTLRLCAPVPGSRSIHGCAGALGLLAAPRADTN